MEKATRQVVMGARELVSERGTHTRISHERENGRARVKEMGNQQTDCQGNGIPIGHQPIQGKEPYRLLVIRIPSCVGQLDGENTSFASDIDVFRGNLLSLLEQNMKIVESEFE